MNKLLVHRITNITVVTVAVAVIRLLMAFQCDGGDIWLLVGTQRAEVDPLVVLVVNHVRLKQRLVPEHLSAHGTRRWQNDVNISDVFRQSVARRSRFSAMIARQNFRIFRDRVHAPDMI